MEIRKEYIEKTKEYLKNLRKKINRKKMLNDEIKILKKRQSLNGGIDLSELDIKSSPGTKDISDLIITCDTKITSKEAQIDRIEHDLRMYELYTRELEVIGKDIINLRYLESKKQKSFEKIAKEVKYSKSSVANKHDEAIETLAFYIFGDEAVYN
ncbi:hypothetical protein [Paraclostridium sordellii]|uniref:hypothetical protein n=1 Tax=Paraclostridium sordellii TaxID=1505 RepID=UPI0005DFE597|nr:hypothetical protein [Paeniclostridium sordellii]CEN21249.1 Uncharacterised protein [[Clostridium] sordellii] [Paeniclostridium sordellii]